VPPTFLERELDPGLEPRLVCGIARSQGGPTLFLEGAGEHGDGWTPLVGLKPELLQSFRRETLSGQDPLESLHRWVLERRRHRGSPATGIAVLLGFDLLAPSLPPHSREEPIPDLLVLAVDASIRFPGGSAPVLTVAGTQSGPEDLEIRADRIEASLGKLPGWLATVESPETSHAAVTSLPRENYLRQVETVKRHIREGDIYQANLTQRFTVPHDGDAFDLYRRLSDAAPAPSSAFVEAGSVAVASVSPETFLSALPDGSVETMPIKGTRPRGETPDVDRALATDLMESPKDRAELLMIVDLERNDLGRICRTGSVRVPQLGELRSFSAVHHLVARVTGQLRPDAGPREMIRATFPGGSVTGAPKIRALEILRDLEPVGRNFGMGSLVWFGDDGSLESSILIRTVVLWGGRAYLGAGGGIVADSDPEEEWLESNDKARRLTQVLGFAPEDAT